MMQEPLEGEKKKKGVCGTCLRFLEGDGEGESDKCCVEQSGIDGGALDNQSVNQSITVVDCPSLSTSRLQVSPGGCKIQVRV